MTTENTSELIEAIERRRNFAIISHPDAGKDDFDGKTVALRRCNP